MNEQNNPEKYVSELRDNRINNTAKVAFSNVCGVILSAFGPFLVRTLMIYHLGDEYAGLNSLYVSVISVLNMAELGFADVILFFLYEPMAKGDIEKTEHYLNVLRKIYRYVGIAVFSIGLIITPFLPMLIKTGIPENSNIYISFIVFLIAVVIQYLIVPEIVALVNAAQKGYLTSVANIAGNVVVYLLQVIAIIVFHSFLLYYVAIIIQALFVTLLRWIIKRKYFSGISLQGNIDPEEKKGVKKRLLSLLGHQMDDKFITSIDSIVLSSILGLTVVTVYGNYMYIVSAVSMFLVVIIGSLTASIGNALVTENVNDNYVRFRAILWLNGMLVAWSMGCIFCMSQPFMRMWMGEGRLLPTSSVVLFCLYYYVSQIRRTVVVFKNAGGMWWEDRFKPYVSMAVNLVVDIVLVMVIGIDGALLSSIICILFIEIPWEGKVLLKGYFGRSVWGYLKAVGIYFLFGALITGIMYLICECFLPGKGFLSILFRGMLVTAAFVFATILVYGKSESFKTWIDSVRILIHKDEESRD